MFFIKINKQYPVFLPFSAITSIQQMDNHMILTTADLERYFVQGRDVDDLMLTIAAGPFESHFQVITYEPYYAPDAPRPDLD